MSKPYRPSNGTEGAGFMECFCVRCWWDRNGSCGILANTLCYEVDDPLYPKEWIRDEGGPRCTQFSETESKIFPADEAAQLALDLEAKP